MLLLSRTGEHFLVVRVTWRMQSISVKTCKTETTEFKLLFPLVLGSSLAHSTLGGKISPFKIPHNDFYWELRLEDKSLSYVLSISIKTSSLEDVSNTFLLLSATGFSLIQAFWYHVLGFKAQTVFRFPTPVRILTRTRYSSSWDFFPVPRYYCSNKVLKVITKSICGYLSFYGLFNKH